ncbi:MAG: hypothetical protein WBR29_09370 [Gammaproteobacteria bacterium]
MSLKTIAIFVVMCISLLTEGCGSSSSSSSSSNTTVILQVVPGPWKGTYNLNGSSNIPVTGTVAAGGFGYFADNDGNVFLVENVPEESPFSSIAIATAPSGQTFPDGNSVDTFSVNGNYVSTATSTNMTGSLTGIDPSSYVSYIGYATTGVNGNFTLDSTVPYTGTPSIAGLQGQWNGYYTGKTSTSADITINADGIFSGNDGYGCSISGSLVQQDPGTNTYFVNYVSSGSGCPGDMNGLAYESTIDVSGDFSGAAGTYFYMGLFGPNVAYSAEFKL